MSNFKERLINSFDSILLVLVAGWSITIGSALLLPATHEHTGTVEIYAMTPADITASAR